MTLNPSGNNYSTAQLSVIASEVNNDPLNLGIAAYKASSDWTSIAALLSWVRDGVTPFSGNGVIGPSGNVSGTTNATPIVVTTSAPHGLATGDNVVISGVGGNTNANGTFLVTVLSSTTFSLQAVSGGNVAGNAAYTSGGTWAMCVASFANLTLPNNGQIPSVGATGFQVLDAFARADLAAATPNAAQVAWFNQLGAVIGNNQIPLLTAAGAENNIIGNCKGFIGAAQTTTIANLTALKFRLGSRAEQILSLASKGTPGEILDYSDVLAAMTGSY
jgi:hypothetical protein